MAGNPKVGRNDRCPCGSGKKYKNCCQTKDAARLGFASWAAIGAVVVAAAVLVFFVYNLTQGGSGVPGQVCPAGQAWSPEHGHCH